MLQLKITKIYWRTFEILEIFFKGTVHPRLSEPQLSKQPNLGHYCFIPNRCSINHSELKCGFVEWPERFLSFKTGQMSNKCLCLHIFQSLFLPYHCPVRYLHNLFILMLI